VDGRSQLETGLLDALAARHGRLPDHAQCGIEAPRCVPDFFYEPNVCVFCGWAVHDTPQQVAADDDLRRELVSRGYRVIVLRATREMEEQLGDYPEVFGRS
jgi:hypothetical protein